MRLLIFTPTYTLPNGQEAASPECIDAIRAQVIGCEHEYMIGRHNPHTGAVHANVLAQYQRVQTIFLEGGYDALLTVEHDNVLPDNLAAQRMLDTPGADVVYAPYVLRHGTNILSTWQYIGDRNLGMSLTRYPDELAKARAAGIWRVSGVGHGCTLFWRHTLEHIQFRKGDGENYAPDIPFASDALAAGYVSMGRFDVPVLHKQNSDWLHPYEDIGVKKYLCRITVAALTPDGKRFNLVAGEWVDMTPEQAIDLASVGFITIPDERFMEEPRSAVAEPEGEQAVAPTPKRGKRAK